MYQRNDIHLFILLLLSRGASAQNAYSVTLPSEVSSFLPTCAQPCLKSSVEQQFPESKCSSNPTLECLCSTTSNSGDTLGVLSGACINFGIRDGLCTGVDAVPTARQNAFKLCSAVQNGTSAVATSTTGIATSSTQSKLQTESTASPIPSPISSGSLSISRALSTSQSSTSAFSDSATATSQPLSPTSSTVSSPSAISTSTNGLTTAEQVGIGIGVTLGSLIVALLGAIIFLMQRRRKRKNEFAEVLPETQRQTYKRETLALADKVLELDSTSALAELGPDMPHEIGGRHVERKAKRKSKTWSMWVRGIQDGGGQAIELDGTSVGDRRR